MGEHVFQSVAFQPRKDFRQFWYQLAKLLRARHGSKIHLYASTPEEARYYRQLDTDGVFDSVTVGYSVLLHAAGQQNLDESEVFARARSIEARIGTTFNAIAATDRHLGRGYSPGGYYYARSELSETTSHVQMVHAIATMLEFWEEQIRDKGVTVFLGGSKYQAVVARAHGVPFCSQLGAGYGNYEYWATDEFNETEQLELAFDSARPASRKIEPMSAPYLQYQVLRSPILEQARLSVFLRDMVRIAARHYYGRMRGYEKTRMSLLSSVFRRRFRRMTGLRRMSRLPFRPLSFLEGKRFVFFPLQTEPETGISFASPEYLSQHHAVIQVSRNLPAGTLLAVKDHFLTVGRRPPAFYDQIAELKNVVLLDAREHGFEAVRRCVAMANVVGHAGIEAASMGKPIVTFGRHNPYNFLDHVFVVDDREDLAALLRGAVDGTSYDPEKARADGLRFLQAIDAISFDVVGYHADGTPLVTDGAVERAYRMLALSAGVSARDIDMPSAADDVPVAAQ